MRTTERYLARRPGRDGAVRWFWQPSPALKAAGWHLVRLCPERVFVGTAPPLAVLEACRARNAELDAWRAGRARGPDSGPRQGPAPGTLDALIARYRASATFAALRATTRRAYNQNLEVLAAWAGPVPVRALTAPMAIELYEALAARTPAKANAVMRVLRLLYGFARLRGGSETVDQNPFQQLRLKGGRGAVRIWAPADVAAVTAAADALGLWSIGTAVMLNEWLGQRQGDLLALPCAAFRDGRITVRQAKTGASVALPVGLVPALAARLEAERARQAAAKVTATTLLVAEATGRPWKADHFRHELARIRAKAAVERPEVAGLWFLWLRHTAVTRLAEAGVEIPQIAAVTGHSLKTCEAILDRYLVRTAKLAEAAFRKRLEEEGK